MSRKILFVVEGKKEQEEIKRDIAKHLNLDDNKYEIVTYGTSIHELSRMLEKKENEGLSLTSILIKNKLINVETNVQLDSTFNLDKYKYIVKNNNYNGTDQIKLLEIQLEKLNKVKEFYVINTMSLLYYDYN